MITASDMVLTSPPVVTPDRLQASVAILADLAATGGRDTAAGLLQGVLRQLRMSSPSST